MFRDDRIIESLTSAWQGFQQELPVAVARAPVVDAAHVPDEVGAVWHVYREIAQRMQRNAFTRHASKLGAST